MLSIPTHKAKLSLLLSIIQGNLLMIEPTRFALFIGISWALIIAPGPDMFYVITRGMAHGRKAGMLSAIGVVCGILDHTTASALGLTLVIQSSVFAFLLVKYVGAAYLLFLGAKTFRDKSTFSPHSPTSTMNSIRLFGRVCYQMFSIPKSRSSFWLFCHSLLIKRVVI